MAIRIMIANHLLNQVEQNHLLFLNVGKFGVIPLPDTLRVAQMLRLPQPENLINPAVVQLSLPMLTNGLINGN